jgi:type VI secretion system protein ImpL
MNLSVLRHWRSLLEPRRLAWALLAAWFAGLLVAAVQLDRWQGQIGRTLLQLQADEQFRARAGPREQVDPEWYRRKALALLAAMEQLRQDAWWTLFMPGSWHVFDDLEERLAARIEREFADIVLETLRRELLSRAGRLTGWPGPGQPPQCAAPQPAAGPRTPSNSPQDLPEFLALRDYLQALRPLDEAAQSWLQLQRPPDASSPAHLRRLVRYTLEAELPGPVSRSVALFGAARPAGGAPDATFAALQAAARCSLLKGTAAIDARLLASNDLLALEQALAERSTGLFDARRAEPFVPAVQRLRAVHALLRQQDALLARGDTAWMREGAPLPPAYEALLAQAAALSLLGPEAARQARDQSAAALAQFRRQFEALFARRGPPALAWDEAHARYVQSPERVALRQALDLLLQEPFMQLQGDGTLAPAPASFDQALAVADQRRRVRQELLPKFPESARPALARLVDQRLVLFAHDAAANAIRASLPQDPAAPFDVPAFRAQRDQVARVQELLLALGAPDLAQRLGTQQAAELSARLARAQQELQALPLFAHVTDFGWWRGEPAPLLKAMGVADAVALQNLLSQQYRQLDAMARQASQYLAAADGALAQDPVAQRWQQLADEVERYRAHLPDSSMLAMERYLLTLGPALQRDNCMEQLLSQLPPRHDDVVALRLTQMHNALAQRCTQLRAQAPSPPVAVTR